MRHRAAVISTAVLLVAVTVGCGRPDNGSLATSSEGGSSVLTSASTPGLATGTAQDLPPVRTCAGHAVTEPTRFLTAEEAVTGIVLYSEGSTHVPGGGMWSAQETRSVPADVVPRLAAALSAPSVTPPPDTACTLVGYMLPAIVVTTANGDEFLAAVPSDGCAPSLATRDIAAEVTAMVTPGLEPLAVIMAERALTTGCGGAKSIHPTPSSIPVTVDVPDTGLSTCVYVTDAAQDTTLGAAGPTDTALVRRLVDTLAPTPPTGCTTSFEDTDVGSFLSVVNAPPTTAPGEVPPYPDGVPLFSVQTDGCHVVVDGGWSILGWADAALVAKMTAATS